MMRHPNISRFLANCFLPIILLLIIFSRQATPVQAADATVGDGTPASCTEAAFDTALATVQGSGSGTITFDCGSAATILFTSQKAISGEVTIDGDDKIILSGANTTRLFLVYAAALHLKNITLSNGFSNTGDGGAIYNNGVLTLDNTTISDSIVSSSFSGGAIVNYGPLTINDSLFENNVGGNGGALYLRFENGDATISGTTFRNNRTTNTTTSGWGGAILLWGADVTIRSSTFEQNVARNGGAIHNSFANTVMTLEANTVLRGNAAADLAGGIYNENGSLLMTKVTIGENTAQVGGGIVNRGNITLTQVTVSGNSANVGGGITNYGIATLTEVAVTNNSANLGGGGIDNFKGTMTLAQVTVSGNSALIGGGIITEGALALTHVTVSNNSADDGGGVYNLKNMTLAHVTFSGNSANNGSAITHSDSVGTGVLTLKNVILNQGAAGTNCFVANGSLTKITSAGFNLSSDGSCLFDQAGDRNSVNPMLGPLTNNGGFTHTHMLLDGSPAIDAGQCVNGLATDQRGLPRLQGAACDIGAVERQPEDGQQGFAIYLPVLVK